MHNLKSREEIQRLRNELEDKTVEAYEAKGLIQGVKKNGPPSDKLLR